ncbi:MAG: alkaline phosphatase family protein [Pseudomonadota bacterium]
MNFDLLPAKPDYTGCSIVNLMTSIKGHYVAGDSVYAQLNDFPAENLDGVKRLILLVVDGLGADLLATFSAATDDRFQQHAVTRMTSVYPPTTATAITTFMSGQAPQQHALTGWHMNFREIGATAAVLPFISRFGKRSLSEQGVDINRLVDCESFSDAVPVAAHLLLPHDIANSDFSRRLGGSAKRHSFNGLDDFADKLVAFASDTNEPAYLYAYWSEFDHLAHRYGPSHQRVFEHFVELQRRLSVTLNQIADPETAILITADHGFLDSGPAECVQLSSHPALADMLAMPLFGEPRSAYCIVRSGCESEFESYVVSELSDYLTAIPSRTLVEKNWFGLGEPHRELGSRLGDYTLQMKDRYTIRDQLVSEHAFDLYGMHGGVTAAELWVPLLYFGGNAESVEF